MQVKYLQLENRFAIELDWSSLRGKNLLPFAEVGSDFFACRAEPTYAKHQDPAGWKKEIYNFVLFFKLLSGQ